MRAGILVAWALASFALPADDSGAAPAKRADDNVPPAERNAPPDPSPPAETPAAVAGVRNLRSLARRVRALSDAELPPGLGLWKTLSKPERVAGGALASGKGAPADEAQFAAAARRWLEDPKLAEIVALEDAGIRDRELDTLLHVAPTDLSAAALKRRNRLLLAAALPHDFVPPPLEGKYAPRDSASYYPPGAPRPDAADRKPGGAAEEVRLRIKAPGLAGKLLVYFEGFDALVVRGADGRELLVPNTGTLGYRLVGDSYAKPYPRTLTWDANAVKDGKATAELRLAPSR